MHSKRFESRRLIRISLRSLASRNGYHVSLNFWPVSHLTKYRTVQRDCSLSRGRAINGKLWSKQSSAGRTMLASHVALFASKISLDIHSGGTTAELAGGSSVVTLTRAVQVKLD